MNLFPLLVLALSALLSACAGPQVSRTNYGRVGVVALIPDKIDSKYLGQWDFSDATTDTLAPGMSSFVVDATATALREESFTAVPLRLTPEVVEQWTRSPLHYERLVEKRVITEPLRDLARQERLDSLVLLMPRPRGFRGEEGHPIGRYGFGTLSEHVDHTQIYAYFTVLWVKTADFTTLTSFPVQQIRQYEVPFRGDFSKYSSPERQRLLAGMKRIYAQEVRKGIRRVAVP